MGNWKQTSENKVTLNYLNTTHVFHVVFDYLHLPEDGILGLPFMQQYLYNLSNKVLCLNNLKHNLIDDGILIPHNQIKLVQIPVGKTNGTVAIFDNPHIPDSIFAIHDQCITVPIYNHSKQSQHFNSNKIDYKYIESEIPEKGIHYMSQDELATRMNLFTENTRLNHIEIDLKEKIFKIINSYHDIFRLPGDLLPDTQLAKHLIVLKKDRIVNNRSYRPP